MLRSRLSTRSTILLTRARSFPLFPERSRFPAVESHHPTAPQMLADLLTISEFRGGSTDFAGMKMAFVGDCQV